NPPVRAKFVLEFMTAPPVVMHVCRDGLREAGLRIKHVEIDESLRIVATTRASFTSFGERISAEARSGGQSGCLLEISSVPRLFTAMVDFGVNYTNVFLLAKFIRDHLNNDLLVSERLIDLERPQT